MARLFDAFPDGPTGLGMLLLRAALGLAALIQAVMIVLWSNEPSAGTWIAGGLAGTTGILLLIGLFTPIASGVVGLAAAAMAVSTVPLPDPAVFASKLAVAFVSMVAIAVVFLGPGAYSIDARIFGLREIIIPPLHPHS